MCDGSTIEADLSQQSSNFAHRQLAKNRKRRALYAYAPSLNYRNYAKHNSVLRQQRAKFQPEKGGEAVNKVVGYQIIGDTGENVTCSGKPAVLLATIELTNLQDNLA